MTIERGQAKVELSQLKTTIERIFNDIFIQRNGVRTKQLRQEMGQRDSIIAELQKVTEAGLRDASIEVDKAAVVKAQADIEQLEIQKGQIQVQLSKISAMHDESLEDVYKHFNIQALSQEINGDSSATDEDELEDDILRDLRVSEENIAYVASNTILIKDLTLTVDGLGAENAVLRREIGDVKGSHSSLEALNKTKQDTIDSLHSDVQRLAKEKEHFLGQLRQLSAEREDGLRTLETVNAELRKLEAEKEVLIREKKEFSRGFAAHCEKFAKNEETLNKRIEELKAEVVATKQSALTRPSRVKDARMPSAEASSSTSIVDGGIGSRRSASSHYVTSLMQQQQPDDATVLPKEVMVADFMREQQQRCLGSASSYPGVMFGFSAIGGSASGGIEGYVPEDKQAAAKQEKKSSSKPAAPRPSQG